MLESFARQVADDMLHVYNFLTMLQKRENWHFSVARQVAEGGCGMHNVIHNLSDNSSHLQ